MSGTARSRSQFLSQVRASFSQPPAVTPQETTEEIADQVLASEMLPTQATQPSVPVPLAVVIPTPPATSVVPTPPAIDELAVLEKALTEVEENVVHREPVVPVPVTALPPISEPMPSTESFAAAVPAAIDQSTQTLNPQQPLATRVKEVVPPSPVLPITEQPQVSMVESSAVTAPVEVTGAGNGYYESGPVSPEIPVEIEAYLQEVKNHQDQLPHEIVVTNDDISLQPQAPALRPVVVLPITPEVEQQGARKSPAMSIRWLVEWSRRLMKMFTGKIIYQES